LFKTPLGEEECARKAQSFAGEGNRLRPLTNYFQKDHEPRGSEAAPDTGISWLRLTFERDSRCVLYDGISSIL